MRVCQVNGVSKLTGEISVPPSKSHTMRAILFACFCRGTSKIFNPLISPDVDALLKACALAGINIIKHSDHLEIEGGDFSSLSGIVDCGNSGQVLRFFGAFAALSNSEVGFTGDHSILERRPIVPLLEGLAALGAKISSKKEGLAFSVRGPVKNGSLTIDGSDSQPVSAFLMLASQLDGITDIYVNNPGEKPWIELTLFWLEKMGVKYENNHFEHYKVFGEKQPFKSFSYIVPGDFSSAAYPIAAALVTRSRLVVKGLDFNDVQGDKKILPLLRAMGADLTEEGDRLLVEPSHLRGIKIDINETIDAINILSVLGCYAEGETELYNGTIARFKECDRIACCAKELRKMGASIEEREDGLLIRYSSLRGASVESHKDHRMALSLAVAALGVKEKVTIEDFDCIKKSYSNFVKEMQSVGAKIDVNKNNIVLIGQMCVGKTTAAMALAQQLGWQFIDTDALLLEAAEEKELHLLYEKWGEELFRELESAVIKALNPSTPSVIATGGGAILRQQNREKLKELGQIIYLTHDDAHLIKEIKRVKPRFVNSSDAQLLALFKEREQLYKDLATLTISVKEGFDTLFAAVSSHQESFCGK